MKRLKPMIDAETKRLIQYFVIRDLARKARSYAYEFN